MSLEVPRGRPGKETASTDVAEQSVTETADKQPLTTAEAERLTTRIGLKLGILADTYESVMPLIREAIDRNAHIALGYPSFGAYAAGRFSDSLSRLGVDMRRDVVKELTAAGMSTRAIASVVGVSHPTVISDQKSGGKSLPPDPSVSPDQPAVTSVTADPVEAPNISSEEKSEVGSPPPNVTGLDGKNYARPNDHDVAVKPRRRPLEILSASEDLRRLAARIEKLANDDRIAKDRARYIGLLNSYGTLRHLDQLNRAIEKITGGDHR